MFVERAFHTRRKGLQNEIEKRAEENDKAAVYEGKDSLAVQFVHFVHFEL